MSSNFLINYTSLQLRGNNETEKQRHVLNLLCLILNLCNTTTANHIVKIITHTAVVRDRHQIQLTNATQHNVNSSFTGGMLK